MISGAMEPTLKSHPVKRTQGRQPDDSPTPGEGSSSRATVCVDVVEARPDGYDGTCLRPLGLCELGGCCDACWYRPDHPRFTKTD